MKRLIRQYPVPHPARIMYNYSKGWYEYQYRVWSPEYAHLRQWEVLKCITNEAWKRGTRF